LVTRRFTFQPHKWSRNKTVPIADHQTYNSNATERKK